MADDSLSGFSPGPLIILMIIMGMIIMYAITVSPAEREQLLGVIPYERDAISIAPGEIIPIPSQVFKLTHNLNAAEPNFALQPISQILSNQITVRRSLIQHTDAKFTVNVKKTDLSAAKLKFEVAAAEGGKELVVELNNNVVFSGLLSKGEATVPLPIGQLNEGANSIVISVASPFTSAAYSLQDVAFVEERYAPEKAIATQTFALSSQELQGLTSARLTALAKQNAQPANLALALNNKNIFNVSLSEDTSINLELPTSLLNNSNTLTWTVSKGGDYQILLGQVATSYSKSPFKTKSYVFSVTDIEYQAKREGKLSCNLEINASTPVTQTLKVQVNAYKLDLRMTDGSLTYDVCPYLQPGENTLSLQSSASIYISSLKLVMAGKAYGV